MNNSKLELWKERIHACKSSGLTVPQWCHNNNLSKNQYYYWHKAIIGLDYETTEAPMFVEVLVENTAPPCDAVIKIRCKNVEMTLSSKNDISLAVEFIHELQKRC